MIKKRVQYKDTFLTQNGVPVLLSEIGVGLLKTIIVTKTAPPGFWDGVCEERKDRFIIRLRPAPFPVEFVNYAKIEEGL